jgi:beta-glucanase (GH16 family)
MEMTGNSAGALTTIVNYANNQAVWVPGIEDAASTSLGNGFTSRTATHVYAFEWTPDQIVWFVDGTVVRTGANSGANDLKVDVPEKSAKILLNLWVFANNAYGGDPANNKYPLYTEVDWFRFYRWNDDTTYPCNPVPACLSAADKDMSKNNAEDGVADL